MAARTQGLGGKGSGRARGERSRSAWGLPFLVPAMVFVVAVLLYPLAYELYMSVHNVSAGNFLAGNAPFVGLQLYREVVADPAFGHSLLITLIYTVSCLAFQFAIGLALALFFNRAFPATACCGR